MTTTLKVTDLNDAQWQVLSALVVEAASNGYDFGVLECVTTPKGMGKQAYGAYVTQLNEGGLVHIEKATKINGRNVTQYTFDTDVKAWLTLAPRA